MELTNQPGLKTMVWDLGAEGGPVQVEMWAVSAAEARKNDPNRYVLELPPGVSPGAKQAENEAARAREADETAKAKARDPHFGTVDKDKEIAELKRQLAEAQKAAAPAPAAVAPSPPPPEPDPPAPKPVAARRKAKPRGRPFTKKAHHHAQPGALP